jgi:hypothetical protein
MPIAIKQPETKNKSYDTGYFQAARNATLTLRSLISKLNPAQRETLSILLDKKTSDQLSKSFKDAKKERFAPIESIL